MFNLKRAFILTFLLLINSPVYADDTQGTVVSSQVTVGSASNTHASVIANQGKGGAHTAANLAGCQAIPQARRSEGMTCTATEDSVEPIVYRLQGGTGNSNWQPVRFGGVEWTSSEDTVYLTATDDSVGIGTTDPSSKVSVVGDVASSGKIITGGRENRIRGPNFAIDFDECGDGCLEMQSWNNSQNNRLRFDLETQADSVSLSGVTNYRFTNGFVSTDNIYLGGAVKGIPFDISDAIVSYYRMEGTSGTTVTDNQGINNGTSSTDLANMTVPGKIGNGLEFNSSFGEYINLGSDSSLKFTGDFEISFWMKTTQVSPARVLGNRSSTGTNIGYEVFMNSTSVAAPGNIGITVDVGSTTTTLRSTSAVNSGEWHLISFVRSGSSLSIYIDAVIDVEPVSVSSASLASAGNTYIGKTPFTESFFSGTIDGLQFFDRILTDDERHAIYKGGTGIEALSAEYTNLLSQVIASTDSVESDFDFNETSADTLIQGKAEVQGGLYLSDCTIRIDGTGGTCTETCTQDGDEPSSVDSDCIIDGIMDN